MTASFYAPIAERVPQDVLADYVRFLDDRNGSLDWTKPYPKREAWLAAENAVPARYEGALDRDLFAQCWEGFDARASSSPALVSLLAFVKINANEAYGVEHVSKKRHRTAEPTDVFDHCERLLGREETYHTRILAGATRQFDIAEPTSSWTPPIAVRALIGGLVLAPNALYHPVLLASELAGTFVFSWLLDRIHGLFADHPAVRASMEARLLEILVDEVGHIAFNRAAVGPTGLGVARALAPHVVDAIMRSTKEFGALGWTRAQLSGFDRFDFEALPETVRRQAFFA